MLQLASIIKSRKVMMHSKNLTTDDSLMPTSFLNDLSFGNLPVCILMIRYNAIFKIYSIFLYFTLSISSVNKDTLLLK
jgi:hypothetical protein